MVKQQARFHLVMLLSRYDNRLADEFSLNFCHRERERSSDKSEIQEINEYWYHLVRGASPLTAKAIRELPTDSIDAWLAAFDATVVNYLLSAVDTLCQSPNQSMS